MAEYQHSSHAGTDLKYHIVWITKCRPKVMRGDIAARARLRIDGLLSLAKFKDRLSPFVQMTVDADLGHGADSIQTFIGIDFDLAGFFGNERPATPE